MANAIASSDCAKLLTQIKNCTLCQQQLPLPAKPIVQFNANSKILIAGQAPGQVTHDKGIPFDDASGERLRKWLGVDRESFYQADNFAIVPMGFCYPGKGKSGDLPPLPLCATTWRQQIMSNLPKLALTIIVGKYAIDWHLNSKKSVTTEVQAWQDHLNQQQLVLPHPSPRNNIWLKRHAWFEQDVIPMLQSKVASILAKNITEET